MTGLGGAGGLDREEVGGQVADGALGLFLGLGPAVAAEGGELRAGLAGPDVLRDQVGFRDGNVKARRFIPRAGGGVLDDEAFLSGGVAGRGRGRAPAAGLCGEGAEAAVDPDAVLEVDDEVAFLELGEVHFEDGTDRAGMAGLQAARSLDLVAPVDLRVGDDDQPGLRDDEPAGQDPDMARGDRFRQVELGPEFPEALPFAFVAAEDMDGVVLSGPPMDLFEEGPALGLGDLWIRQGVADGAEGVESGEWEGRFLVWEGGLGQVDAVESTRPGEGEEVVPVHGVRVSRGDLLAVAEGLVEEGVGFAEQEGGILGEQVEEGAQRGDGRGGGVGCARAILGVGWGGFGEPGACRLEEAEFAGGRDDDLADDLAGDLGLGIELAEGFEFIAEELEPDGPWGGEGPDVDDAASPGQFALSGDLGLGFVALFLEPFDEVERVERVASAEGAGAFAQVLAGEGALEEGDDGSDDDAWTVLRGGQADEGLEAFRDDVGVGQLVLVGEGLPGGVKEGWMAWLEPGVEVGMEAFLGFEAIGDDDEGALGMGAVAEGSEVGLGGRGDAGEGDTRGGVDGLDEGVEEGFREERGWARFGGNRVRCGGGSALQTVETVNRRGWIQETSWPWLWRRRR